MNDIPKFQRYQQLTAQSLNRLVEAVNNHERRLLSQAITSGKGYTFTTSQGGTSLNITGRGSGDESGNDYEAPFRVRFIKEEDGLYYFRINGGTVYGGDGSCASYETVKRDDNFFLDIANNSDDPNGQYLVLARFISEPMAVIDDWTNAMPTVPDDPDDDGIHATYIAWQAIQAIMNAVGTPLARSIPFKGEFAEFTAMSLQSWKEESLAHVGSSIWTPHTNSADIYGMDNEWEVCFPIALITLTENENPRVEQLLHSDIFWNMHWTNDINVDGSGKIS